MSELVVGSIAGLAANSYVVSVASGSQLTQPGMVLQVVSATYSSELTTNSTSYVDTGLSASITPTSSSSKILVIVNQPGLGRDTATTQVAGYAQIVRDATSVYEIEADFTTPSTASLSEYPWSGSMVFLDSPATASSVTYKTQVKVTGSLQLRLQRNNNDASITLMEVAG